MIYASIDLETTGLQPEWCQVLEIGCVVDDLQQPHQINPPTFHAYIRHEKIRGQPYALNLNRKILEILADNTHPHIMSPHEAGVNFHEFLNTHFGRNKVTAAGKNFQSFDMPFLTKLWNHINVKEMFHQRSIDPAFSFLRPDDKVLPDLQECLKRAGVNHPFQLHTAIDDAKAVVALVRHISDRNSQ